MGPPGPRGRRPIAWRGAILVRAAPGPARKEGAGAVAAPGRGAVQKFVAMG
jgi:hypothetical protein